jgi:hypothetical protein
MLRLEYSQLIPIDTYQKFDTARLVINIAINALACGDSAAEAREDSADNAR